MSRLYRNFLISILCCLSLFFSMYVKAQDEVLIEKKVIVTPAPKSTNCTLVPGHWQGSIWIDTQTVCTYPGRQEGVAWVQDYWTCTVYDTASGECTSWEHQPGHWVKTLP